MGADRPKSKAEDRPDWVDSGDSVLNQFLWAMRAGSGPPKPFDELPDLPSEVRQRIITRLESAWAEGLLRLDPEQYADVLMCLLPEDFVVSLPTGPGSADPIGSTGRLASYRDRAARRETCCGPIDAEAVRNDKAGVKVRQRTNGRRIKTEGWSSPRPEPIPDGMYRDATGQWFEIGV